MINHPASLGYLHLWKPPSGAGGTAIIHGTRVFHRRDVGPTAAYVFFFYGNHERIGHEKRAGYGWRFEIFLFNRAGTDLGPGVHTEALATAVTVIGGFLKSWAPSRHHGFQDVSGRGHPWLMDTPRDFENLTSEAINSWSLAKLQKVAGMKSSALDLVAPEMFRWDEHTSLQWDFGWSFGRKPVEDDHFSLQAKLIVGNW